MKAVFLALGKALRIQVALLYQENMCSLTIAKDN